MTLRGRLSLAMASLAAFVVTGFGVYALQTVRHHLDAQLEAVLMADLERVAALLDQPTVGASFGATSVDVILQFLTADGVVALWWGEADPLPSVRTATQLERDGRRFLVAEAPWRAAEGSIRLAHDVTDAVRARDALLAALLAAGLTTVALAALAAVLGVRAMLRPLDDLARQTRGIDPAAPGAVTYDGPRDEVGTLAGALNDAFGAIRERQEGERRFLLEVSHELAAPLTIVDYHLDVARRGTGGSVALDVAAHAARELLRTSQDLLAIARGDLERRLDPQIVDLATLVERVAGEYPGVLVAKGASGEVAGDPERLAQVVRNVVRNAVQASGSASGVELTLRRAGDEVVLEIRDSGPGMTSETLARAFEHGYSRGSGAGVGLSVARSLVERHGGRIEVPESGSEGTVVAVHLPSLESRLGDRLDELPGDHPEPDAEDQGAVSLA
jgi:two-component system, OmpR family, sensor kinase